VKRLVLFASLALAAGCSDPAGNELSVTVTAPPAAGDSADASYIIEWDLENVSWPEAYDNLSADTATDPSTGLVMLAESLDTGDSGWLWDCSGWPGDDYYVRAVVHEGYNDESDYSDGALTVRHPAGD